MPTLEHQQETVVRARICKAMAAMPYGAGIALPAREEVTLESIADYLEALAERLRPAAAQATDDRLELLHIRSTLRALTGVEAIDAIRDELRALRTEKP